MHVCYGLITSIPELNYIQGDLDAEYETLVSRIAELNSTKFMDNIKYSYNGKFSVPVNAVKKKPVQGHTDVVSVGVVSLQTAMQNYIDNTLITAGSAPSWAVQDLRTYISGHEASWQVHSYTNSYLNPKLTDDYPAFAMDGQILFGVFDLQKEPPTGGDPIVVPSLLLSYIGVSYPAFTWGEPINNTSSKAVMRYSFAA